MFSSGRARQSRVNYGRASKSFVKLTVESLEPRLAFAVGDFDWTGGDANGNYFDILNNWADESGNHPIDGFIDATIDTPSTVGVNKVSEIQMLTLRADSDDPITLMFTGDGLIRDKRDYGTSVRWAPVILTSPIIIDDGPALTPAPKLRFDSRRFHVGSTSLLIENGVGVKAGSFSHFNSQDDDDPSAMKTVITNQAFLSVTTTASITRADLLIHGVSGASPLSSNQTAGYFNRFEIDSSSAVVDSHARLFVKDSVGISDNRQAPAELVIDSGSLYATDGDIGIGVRGKMRVTNESTVLLGTSTARDRPLLGEGPFAVTNVGIDVIVGSGSEGSLSIEKGSQVSGQFANLLGVPVEIKIGVTRDGAAGGNGIVSVSEGSNVDIENGKVFVGGQGFGKLSVISDSDFRSFRLSVGTNYLDRFGSTGAGEVVVGNQSKISVIDSFKVGSFGLLLVNEGGAIYAEQGINLGSPGVFSDLVDTGLPISADGYALNRLPIVAGAGVVRGGVSGTGQIIAGADGSLATLTIDGTLTLGVGSQVLADVSNDRGNDVVDVSGVVSLTGELKVRNIGGALEEDQAFDIVEALTITGDFDNVKRNMTYAGGANGLPLLEEGLKWKVTVEGTAGGGQYLRLRVVRDDSVNFGQAGYDQFSHDVDYIVDIPDHDDEVTYTFTVYGGTAHLGQHFDVHHPAAANVGDTATGTLTFAPHQTREFIILSIKDFNLYETGAPDTRSFSIDLVDDYGDLVFAGNGAIRSFYYSLSFDGTTPDNEETFDEGDSNARAYVMISAAPFEGVLADFRTIEQTAKAGKDYQAVSSTANFAAGSMAAQEVKLNILDDYLYERVPEQFQAKITNLMAGTFLPGYGLATVKIRDNEQVPTVVIADKEVTVGGTLQFRAYLSNASAEAISISYQTQDGSAQDGLDYDGVNGTLYFAPEYTSVDIEAIDTHADYQSGTKSFYLTLSTTAGTDEVKLPDLDPVGTILDGQEWVEGYWAGNYEYQNLGHMVSRWVGTHWVEDYYVGGHWDGGNWVEGILTGGDWVAGHYEGGTWVDGHYDGSDWVDAHYEGGTFIAGHYDGGTFVSGHYENGAWVEGAWLNDQWVDGHYEGGTFLAGHMEGQQFVPGHMEGQEFVAGHMENQTFIPGHNETPWIDAVYDEYGELVTPGHDGDPYWVGDAWVGGNWVDDAWVGGTWVDDEWTGGTWIDDQWIDQTWVQGYYALQQWIDAHYQQIWVDDHWEGQFWVDDHWENQTWIDGHFANQTWIDAHWENQAWVDGYWINQTWTDGHWENQTWVDAYTAGHWADDYVDEWVDNWQYVWVDYYVEGHWITT